MESGQPQKTYSELTSGTKMPRIGYGTGLMPEKADNFVKNAIKAGFRHIDTASFYGNEDQIGKAIKEVISEGIVKREDLFITTKIWNDEKHDVAKALDNSLKRLQLDYVDLYLIHWPLGDLNKETNLYKQIPLHKTWKELEDLVKAGKTRAIGISNFNVQAILDLLSYAEIKPVCNQIELHPYLPQEDLVAFCKKYDIEVVAYCPLGGFIEGFSTYSVKTLVEEPIIKELAAKYNKTPAQVILSWHLTRGYCVIPKTTTESRLKENLEASTFTLTAEEVKKVNSLNKNFRVCDPKIMGLTGYTPLFV